MYHAIVRGIAARNFTRVNDKDYGPLLKDCVPNVHHRFSGSHALGGERHDREALCRWFHRLGRLAPTLAGSSGQGDTRLDLGRAPVRLSANRAGTYLPLIRPDVGAREGPQVKPGSPCRDDHLIPPTKELPSGWQVLE
jgi:hypothetical protein